MIDLRFITDAIRIRYPADDDLQPGEKPSEWVARVLGDKR